MVTGTQKTSGDVYNYIRLEFPQAKSRYEFRFEPLPGATVIDAFGSQEVFEHLHLLPTVRNSALMAHRPTASFKIYYTGRFVAQATLLTNKELGGTTKGFQA